MFVSLLKQHTNIDIEFINTFFKKFKIGGELNFEIKEILIDGDQELQSLYGEQIPVTQIDGVHHDYWRVDPERFRSSLEKHRQRQ